MKERGFKFFSSLTSLNLYLDDNSGIDNSNNNSCKIEDFNLRKGYCVLHDVPAIAGAFLDASHMNLIPSFVFFPRSKIQLKTILVVSRMHKIPITFMGGGTGLSGGYANYASLVVMDNFNSFDKEFYKTNPHSMKLINADELLVDQSVLVSEAIKFAEHETYGEYIFPIQPSSSHKLPVRIGGLISTNAGGLFSGKLGCVKSWIKSMKVMVPNGDIIEISANSEGNGIAGMNGYNKKTLFNRIVGGDGYFGIILNAVFKLFKSVNHDDDCFRILYGTDPDDVFNALEEVHHKKIFPLVAEFITTPGNLACKNSANNLTNNSDNNPNNSDKFSPIFLPEPFSSLHNNAQWAFLLRGTTDIVTKFSNALFKTSDVEKVFFKNLNEEEFSEFVKSRTSLALYSISKRGAFEVINFPGFEDILIKPRFVPMVLRDLNQIITRYDYKRIWFGYGHLNFKKGSGVLLHVRLPILLEELIENRSKTLTKATAVISEVLFYLYNKYQVRPKAEHSYGALGIFFDEKWRQYLTGEIKRGRAFYNPHINVFNLINKNENHEYNEIYENKDNKDKDNEENGKNKESATLLDLFRNALSIYLF